MSRAHIEKAAKDSGDYPDPKAEPLIVFLPSHDHRSMVQTIMTVSQIGLFLQRPLLTSSCGGLGQAVAMKGMVDSLMSMCLRTPEYRRLIKRDEKDKRYVRALWIEDDIEPAPWQAEEIAEMITASDINGYNIVTPYTTGPRDDGALNWVYFKKPEGDEIGRPFTEDEIQALKPFDKIDGLAGLGFYYGVVYLDYVWYEGTFNGKDRFGLPSYSGIDWNYFLDNKIELRHYPIYILHEKTIGFGNTQVLKNYAEGSLMHKFIVQPKKKPAIGSPEDRA